MMFPTAIEEKIGYVFRDRELLNQAITHSSFFNEKRDIRRSDNEKLEYLGDAVLNCIISIILYKKYKDKHEGFLSNARSCLVRRDTLTEITKNLNFMDHLNYGNGRNCNVPEESKVLSNMLEALIGAVYLDGGFIKTRKVIKKLFEPYFTEERITKKSPKNMLQEYSQKRWGILPQYKFTRKTKNGFTVNVYLGRDYRAKGQGKTKKEAQQQAAMVMLEMLQVR
ncbi:MAG TPA: ribonuclease III [Syntrophorhabdaceae bacterium]|nr:ribonuclease III [Syntrophorhabdaceae bacterium]